MVGIARRVLSWPLAILLSTLFLLPSLPTRGQQAQWTPEETFKVKSVGNVAVSPDGSQVLYTVRKAVLTDEESTYLTHLYRSGTDGAGATQLTHGSASVRGAQWSPDGAWIAYLSARSGRNNIWILPVDGGEARQLTDVATGVQAFLWSPDASQIAFTMRDALSTEVAKARAGGDDADVVDEDETMTHLWVISLDGAQEAQRLTEGDFSITQGFDWSPDGRTLVFAHAARDAAEPRYESDLSTVTVATGTLRPLVHTTASEFNPHYAPTGDRIAYTATEDPPNRAHTYDMWMVDVQRTTTHPFHHTFDRNVDLFPDITRPLGWSADGQRFFVSEQERMVSRIWALPVDGGPPVAVDPGERLKTEVSLNATRTHFGFVSQRPDAPPEVHVSAVSAFSPVQVSQVNADLPDYPLGRTETISWTSSDGVEIEGLLTYPVGYAPGTRYPLVLHIHGGPASAFEEGFIVGPSPYPTAVLAAEGYAVLRPNPRGSMGYGKDFRHAVIGDWGGMDYKDLMAGVDHVIEQGVADPDRLAVVGWSYGGYMTSWVITQTDRFKAAVAGAPPTNLVSFYGTTDIPGFAVGYMEHELWEDYEAYTQRSAIFHVANVTTPTLIHHGVNDARVPISQGYELYRALKRMGEVPVRMVRYPRSGHGLGEPKHQLNAMRHTLDWLNQHVLKEAKAGTN